MEALRLAVLDISYFQRMQRLADLLQQYRRSVPNRVNHDVDDHLRSQSFQPPPRQHARD